MPEQESANLGALSDLCTPWCVRVVATLRIADHIVAGTAEIDDLAAAAGCDSYALHGVLSYLEIIERDIYSRKNRVRDAMNSTKYSKFQQGIGD